jgi:hypothetical protein
MSIDIYGENCVQNFQMKQSEPIEIFVCLIDHFNLGLPSGGTSACGEGRGVGADQSDINRRAPKPRIEAVHDFNSTALTCGIPAVRTLKVRSFGRSSKAAISLLLGKISNPLGTINHADREACADLHLFKTSFLHGNRRYSRRSRRQKTTVRLYALQDSGTNYQ